MAHIEALELSPERNFFMLGNSEEMKCHWFSRFEKHTLIITHYERLWIFFAVLRTKVYTVFAPASIHLFVPFRGTSDGRIEGQAS